MTINSNSNILELKNSLYECPPYWQKFVRHYNPTGGEEDLIEQVLLDHWGAIFQLGNKRKDYVEFPDQESKFAFILEWS
jgi:hypothetical protein